MSGYTAHKGEYLNQAMVDVARIAKITRQLYERQQFAYLLVDHNWSVIEASANLENYGFGDVRVGDDAREAIDFLVGLDSHSTLDLPIVLSPSQNPVHIVLLPEDESLTVVLMDASRDYEQQQLVQQKANENELLLAQQRQLMADLEQTQAALVTKNTELREASRLQSSFLSGVSHEFRTPLAALLGYVDVLGERLLSQSQEESEEQLKVIRRSGRHLLSLVENLLDHGKFDAGEVVLNPQAIDLQGICDEVHAMLHQGAASKQIALEFDTTPTPLPSCLIDDSRLRQIMLNIIGNAIKFTDEGKVQVIAQCADEQFSLRIRDTGMGISKDDMQNVMRPFWQAPKNGKVGTGLGLTITERIVEMMGGQLKIDSELGVGTTVDITIPAPLIELDQPDINSNRAEHIGARRYLLAEDDPDIAALLKLLLVEQGAEVTHVENGQQAIEIAEREEFDVILMDLQMPVLDGYDATKSLRDRGDKTPVLVMTASAIEADRTRAEEVGCDGYLIKPVAVHEVLSLADELLQNQSAV